MVGMREFRAGFFDRDKVMRGMDRATRAVFSRFGAYVRTKAQQSIRTRAGPSKPGNPPHSHTGLLRKFIWFAWDGGSRSVVVGPVPLPGMSRKAASGTTVPAALEYGGPAIAIEQAGQTLHGATTTWIRRDALQSARPSFRTTPAGRIVRVYQTDDGTSIIPRKGTRLRACRLAARPYMRPAFAKVIDEDKLKQLWATHQLKP